METLKTGFEIFLWLLGICVVAWIYWRIDEWKLSEFGTRYLRSTPKVEPLDVFPTEKKNKDQV